MIPGKVRLTGQGLQVEVDNETVAQIKNVLNALKTLRKAEAETDKYFITAKSYPVSNSEDREGHKKQAIQITIIPA